MPCSENFYRYKKNYEKYVNQNPTAADEKKTESKLIASPKIMKKMSPINKLA